MINVDVLPLWVEVIVAVLLVLSYGFYWRTNFTTAAPVGISCRCQCDGC